MARFNGMASLAMLSVLTLGGKAGADSTNTISAVQMARDAAGRTIRIRGSTQPTFQRFTLNDPFRLVLDFVDASISGVPAYTSVGDSLIESIKVEDQGVSGSSLSRVMVTFRQETDFRVSTEGTDVIIAMNGAGAAGDVAERPEPVTTLAQADTGGETSNDVSLDGSTRAVSMVGFRFHQDVSRIFVRTNDKVRYSVREMGERSVVIELQNTQIPLRNNERFLDTQYFGSPVQLIQPESIEGGTPTVRIKINLKNNVAFTHKQVDNEIWVDFPNG
ncbi:MAG: AMIN domain-containing protein [Pseudomonadota bacterium]